MRVQGIAIKCGQAWDSGISCRRRSSRRIITAISSKMRVSSKVRGILEAIQTMATLHFICGKAASGKTTLARELVARHAAVLFCEDEWLTLLEAQINNLADFAICSKRLRAALAPHAVRLLQLGMPIVLDFAGNTPKDRAWVRSIFESADADHVLHCILASDELCKARLRLRNATKPERTLLRRGYRRSIR